MPVSPFTASRRPLLALLLHGALVTPDVRAIVINEAAFKRYGGDLNNIDGTSELVDMALLKESQKPRFHSAGLLKLTGIAQEGCHQTNATWLGEDAAFVYLLAAAYCLSGQDRNAKTRFAQVEFMDWQGRGVVSGEGRVFFPPHGNAMQMALVRLPRPADKPLDILRPLLPPVWINDTYRYGHGQISQPMSSMEVVGHGKGGIGNKTNDVFARRYGVSTHEDFTVDDPNTMLLGYDAETDSDRWARAGQMDNGSGWYERRDHEGMLTGVSVAANQWRSRTARVSAFAPWIRGIYPGVRIATETAHAFNGSVADAYPLTERRPLVTTDLSLNGLTGERRQGLSFNVPFDQDVCPRRSGTPGHTRFQVPVKDAETSVETRLTLRGQKMTPCAGLLAMNDPHDCAEGGDGRLMLSYWPEDNPTLAQGRVFVGTFEISALYNVVDRSNFRIVSPDVSRVDLRISTRQLGRVTATKPFDWDYRGAVHRAGVLKEGEVRRPNRFTFSVPVQAGVMEPVEMRTDRAEKPTYTLVGVVAHDVLRQQSEWKAVSPNSWDRHVPKTTRVIHLRARLGQGCGEAKPCAPQDRKRRLTVSFSKEDNPDLPPGIYRGRFDMDGSHVSGAGAEHNKLSVDVDLETL